VSVVAVASEANHTGNRRQSTSGSGWSPAGKAGRVRSAADGLEAEKTEAVRQGHLFVLASVWGRLDKRGELVVVDGGRFVGAFVVVVVVVPGRTQGEDGGGAEVFEGNSHLKEQKSRKFCRLVSFCKSFNFKTNDLNEQQKKLFFINKISGNSIKKRHLVEQPCLLSNKIGLKTEIFFLLLA
jgi:hypothetical protein